MARRPRPTSDDIALLQGTTRFELFRRMRGYAQAHLDHRLFEGATDKEVAWLRRDLGEFSRILYLDPIFPLDNPPGAGEPPIRTDKDPIAPPGREAELLDIMNTILGDPA